MIQLKAMKSGSSLGLQAESEFAVALGFYQAIGSIVGAVVYQQLEGPNVVILSGDSMQWQVQDMEAACVHMLSENVDFGNGTPNLVCAWCLPGQKPAKLGGCKFALVNL